MSENNRQDKNVEASHSYLCKLKPSKAALSKISVCKKMFPPIYFRIFLCQLQTKQPWCESLRKTALHIAILLHAGAGNSSPQRFIQTFKMSHSCKTHYLQQREVSLKVYVDIIFKWYFLSPK